MNINMNNLVSISEANQNFSKIAKMVDENGTIVILKNNKPRYVLMEYNQLIQKNINENIQVEDVAQNILSKHIKAFEELAK